MLLEIRCVFAMSIQEKVCINGWQNKNWSWLLHLDLIQRMNSSMNIRTFYHRNFVHIYVYICLIVLPIRETFQRIISWSHTHIVISLSLSNFNKNQNIHHSKWCDFSRVRQNTRRDINTTTPMSTVWTHLTNIYVWYLVKPCRSILSLEIEMQKYIIVIVIIFPDISSRTTYLHKHVFFYDIVLFIH